MNRTIFLVRHAAYDGHDADPGLSEYGKQQSLDLANKIKSAINGNSSNITIWTSSALRAFQTAEIIKQEMQLAEMIIEEKLWSDNNHSHDFYWLEDKIDGFTEGILIIVSHLEYVRQFPERLGFRHNNAGYAGGVKIDSTGCNIL